VLPLSAWFFNVLVLICAFYRRIKSRWCDWKKTVHTVIYRKTQRVYSFLGNHHQHTAAIDQNHQRKPLCWALKWDLRLAVARKRKWEIPPDSGQRVWSEPLTICCGDIFWYGGWLGALIGNYARYLEEINIREDKLLLLYHYLLELGLPKVNVSEQQYP
jgi:hypothetical protein